MSHREQHKTPIQAALELYAALRDSRLPDVAALTTPDVLCKALTRPGLSLYYGHQGMANLARYIHAAYGDYTVAIISATEQPDPQVTVRARIDPQPGHGPPLRRRLPSPRRGHLR